ncbi:serine hydrolase domain-containing protein [Amycolatopsis sp. NPDC049688]|uniref:serine hydrolase domain-containing protein n=1 Tax=Amycolatopsis sp. NPDC049688 TaxID=3154733 RepID=UPI003427B200
MADAHPIVQRFHHLVQRHQVPGAQLALYLDGEMLQTAAGVQECGTGRPVRPESKFPAASISKSFTATTAMLLVADGDLELDLPIGAYLPELESSSTGFGAAVTLRQILSHTSGLPDLSGTHTTSLRRYAVDSFHGSDFVLSPGQGFSYSNLGYALAGLLIEEATGMNWWQAVDRILLKPLGLEGSFAVSPGTTPRGGVSGHSVRHGHVRPVAQTLSPAEAPIGGIAASAADLVTFGRAHLYHEVNPHALRLLDAGTLRQMHRAAAHADAFGLADGWGLGLALFRGRDTEWWGHDGAADGIWNFLRIHPENGCVIAVTTNAGTGLDLWIDLSADLRDLDLPRPQYTAPPLAQDPVPAVPEYSGTYANGETRYSIVAQDGRAYCSIDRDTQVELTCYPPDLFSVPDPLSGSRAGYGRFARDPVTGTVTGIRSGGRFAKRTRSS